MMDTTLAPEMAALAARVAAEDGPQPDPTTLPPAEGRALSIAGNRRWNTDMPPMVRREMQEVPANAALGTPARRMLALTPPNARPGAIVFVHGGGFAFCSIETHERCARVLAERSGLTVLLPDYRLAPEDPFPAGLMDTVAALRHVHTDGPLLLAGDSAGANLALAATLHELRAGRALPAALLLFYGVYAADFTTESYTVFADGPGLTRGKMQRYWDFYLSDSTARADALASPLHATDDELRRLPPMHLMAAGVDPLLSDTLNFAARLHALGRPERASIVPGVVHGFLQMSQHLPQARQALEDAGDFARRLS